MDKPLASSYVRGFDGWSTAYPPEMSAPTTLRHMENIVVTPEGALRIRPGLRSVFPEDFWLSQQGNGEAIVGGFEHFLTNEGKKALLFAVRIDTGKIYFRTVVENNGRFEPDNTIIPDLGTVELDENISFIKYLQIDNKILALPDDTTVGAILFYVGTSKAVKRVAPSGLPVPEPTDEPSVIHPEAAWILTANKVTSPDPETATTETLFTNNMTTDTFRFGYYYTFETEFGESAPSGIRVVRAQRGWSAWKTNKPNADGSESTVVTADPSMAMDQFVARLPAGQYETAKSAGAIRWNLYMFAWSTSTPVPSVGTLVAKRDITPGGTHDTEGWLANTPAALADAVNTPVPNAQNRENYSGAPTATQGLVAADRLILVNDAAGRISWTSGAAQEYLNFTPTRGGGQKTLSAGNLSIPVSVVLWQNPQAVDTLTVLCSGLDGYHNAYYMAPSSVSGQSDSTVAMGFEETTATPGTPSPYGCEVFKSALYHPLEQALLKSTANNYALTHTTVTDDIANVWKRLRNKKNIISSQLNEYLYFIVDNPQGEPVPDDCMGNEIWVLNPSKEGNTWSRWLIPAIALRRLEIEGLLYMGVVTPSAIFILDPLSYVDDVEIDSGTLKAPILWYFETNTLGANSRHDIEVKLQQAELHFGGWLGTCRWGIKGWDTHGRPRNIVKLFQGAQDGPEFPTASYREDLAGVDLGDTHDPLLIETLFTEWTLWASSEEGRLSYGQIDMARFRFAQLSVNNGYALGSVQSFEYARNVATGNNDVTQNGIPRPILDSRRP